MQLGAVITWYHDITYITAVTITEYDLQFEPMHKDTQLIALMGKLWRVFSDAFSENWPHYNGTALYL